MIPSAPRAMAATPVRETSTRPTAVISLMKRSTSSRRAGELEDERGQRRIQGAGAEGGGEAHRLDPMVALADDLDEAQLALDRLAGQRQVDDPVHRHEPLELALDLLDDCCSCPVVTMVMREICASCSVSVTVRLSML